jgi:hypothetical protein
MLSSKNTRTRTVTLRRARRSLFLSRAHGFLALVVLSLCLVLGAWTGAACAAVALATTVARVICWQRAVRRALAAPDACRWTPEP